MKEILVVMEVRNEHKSMLSELGGEYNITYIGNKEVTLEDAKKADAIVGNINPVFLKDCSNLKLLQLNSAGKDKYIGEGVLPKGCVLCNATGAYGLALSEHMLGLLFMMMKHLDCYYKDQMGEIWGDNGEVKSIWNSNTLVVGLGDIGSEFAKRMSALGSSVSAIKKTPIKRPDYIEKIGSMDDLYSMLSNADIVASCLPGGESTYRIYDEKAFSNMKEGAYFINVGRGVSVDQDALCDALDSGKLAGAALDVTDPEPLPKGHRMWSTKNLIITPHIAGQYHLPETRNRIIKIAINNIKDILG